MSVMSLSSNTAWTIEPDLWRCVACGGTLSAASASAAPGLECGACGRVYPVRDGVLVVKEALSDNNLVVREYYDGPEWPRFRFWEWLTFLANGGERRSREKILRHLPTGSNLRLLDVAVGDGVYLDWLPEDWGIVGIDISPIQLAACRRRMSARDVPLVLGEAEELPFQDDQFDAILSIGGFNYFNDPEGSLREMVRVARPGATIVVADEIPNLTDRMNLGHKIGLPGIDRWVVGQITKHLSPEFNAIVERFRSLDVAAIGNRVLADCRYELVWQGVGYVMVGRAPG